MNQRRMTIKEFAEYSFYMDVPFINIAEGIFFLDYYVKYYKFFDMLIVREYGDREIYGSEKFHNMNKADIAKYIWEIMFGFILTNEYRYAGLYNSTQFKYDPIVNYDRKEHWKDVRTPDLTTEVSDKNHLGERISTLNLGEGQTSSASENSVYSFNNNVPNPNPRDSSTTSISEQARMNTSTDSAVNDTRDVDTFLSGTDTTEHWGDAKGNIGVTTTQQMIQSERELMDFSFYRILFRELINELCADVY